MILPSPFTITYPRDAVCHQLQCTVKMCYKSRSIDVPAIWDTGASMSCVSVQVVRELDLVARGATQIYTANGSITAFKYYVDIELHPDHVFRDVLVTDSDIGSQGLGALIGMDIISAGDFCVSNYKNQTVFTFRIPSRQRIDFVAQDKLQKQIGSHGKGTKKSKHKK